MRVALLEDDGHMAELMRLWLQGEGFDVQVFGQGNQLIRALGRESFDMVIVDWVLPDIPGDQVLVWLREHLDWPIPALFVSQRDDERDIVRALELGADDYMTKPLSQQVLLARVKALLRRAQQFTAQHKSIMEYPPFVIDAANHRILREGIQVELTQKEYELAAFLFNNLGRVISRGHILESVWGCSSELNTRTVDTHISRLRSKLGLSTADCGMRLTAIYQHGYRLEQVEADVA